MASSQKCAILPAAAGIREGVLEFMKTALEKDCFDAVLMPAKMPDSDSFTYMLIRDEKLLENACLVPPVMPVQAAKAVSGITKLKESKRRIAALIRPCEARATVELFKLGQVDLENVTLISIDCPGAMPLSAWASDPKGVEERFSPVLTPSPDDNIRQICRICDKFSSTGAEDLHIGTLGVKPDTVMLIPGSAKGEDILKCVGLKAEEDASEWESAVEKLTESRTNSRKEAHKELQAESSGLDKLLHVFSKCINCHNCMRVCPICYCQQCFFDSAQVRLPFEDYLGRAEDAGGLRLPPATSNFQIGRMLHMSLSCVSCGACEDACPMDIPVAQLFNMVADRNQAEFGYSSGRSTDESPPLRVYRESEFEEVEQSYAEAASAK